MKHRKGHAANTLVDIDVSDSEVEVTCVVRAIHNSPYWFGHFRSEKFLSFTLQQLNAVSSTNIT